MTWFITSSSPFIASIPSTHWPTPSLLNTSFTTYSLHSSPNSFTPPANSNNSLIAVCSNSPTEVHPFIQPSQPLCSPAHSPTTFPPHIMDHSITPPLSLSPPPGPGHPHWVSSTTTTVCLFNFTAPVPSHNHYSHPL